MAMETQTKNRQRFPQLLSVAVNDEILDALKRGTCNGLLTVSDTTRLALYEWACSRGYIQPEQPTHTNGGSNGQQTR